MGREGGRWSRVWCSGVCGIDDAFVRGGPSSVPAAVATLLPDAGIVFGLVAGVAEIGEHVGPETLILGAHKARQVVAGLDLQLDNSHWLVGRSAMVDLGLRLAQVWIQNLGPLQVGPSPMSLLVKVT